VKPLLIYLTICAWLLAAAGPAAAQRAEALNQAGLDHFTKAFYEYTPHGQSAQAAKEYSLAEQYFQVAIRMQPNWVDPYLHLARTYFVQKKYQQAAELYQKALAIAPERKDIYLRWASALEKAGDYQGAIKVLQNLRALETDKHALAKLDELLQSMATRAQASPTDKKGGRQP
jgi:tetratricopeptide (TPR) repeat protein